MRQFVRDTGIVIRKRKLQKDHRLITILTQNSGKINVMGYGVRQLLSKRLGHLETGNYVSFTYYKNGDYNTLGETELVWGFSKIKKSGDKLNTLFLLFFILDRIVPESEKDTEIFSKTLGTLRRLNNAHVFAWTEIQHYLNELLLITGFIGPKQASDMSFNTVAFIEGLIDKKIAWVYRG